MTRRTLFTLAGGIAVLLLTPHRVPAILGIGDTAIVLDPSNLSVNAYTKAQTYLSNMNEARMILQKVESMAQDARHLISIPVNTLNELQSLWQQYTAIVAQGQGVLGELKGTVSQFEQLYASGWGGNGSFMQRAQGLLGKVREVGAIATRADSLYQRLGSQQRRVQTVLTASQAAPGSLAAQQATNQLLGTLADQQASLQLIMAAQSEMQTSWIMSQVVAAETAAANGMAQQINPTKYLRTGAGWGQGQRLP